MHQYILIAITAYCTASYIGGWMQFMGNSPGIGGFIAFLLSPISLPGYALLAFIVMLGRRV